MEQIYPTESVLSEERFGSIVVFSVAAFSLLVASAIAFGCFAIWGKGGLAACCGAYVGIAFLGLMFAAKNDQLGLVGR